MKINLQAKSSASNRLILISKDKKISASFLKQNHISKQTLHQASKLGATSYSSENKACHLLELDSNAAAIVNKLASWIQKNKTALGNELAVIISKEIEAHLTSVVLGILRGRYEIGLFKSIKKDSSPFSMASAKLTIIGATSVSKKTQIRTALDLYTAQKMAMDMVNAPGNKLKPSDMAKTIKAASKSGKYSVKVLSKKQMEQTGLDALLAVNRGSEWDPAFIIAEYKGKVKAGKKLPKIGLVGKGVTFDTGGISIKASTNMQYMKSDMGGAAAALGTLDAAARLQLPIHLIAIVPATDNCVDATAIKPGDIIGSYSGKTIEVTDTDAEGRLVLADGLWYMQKHFKPEVMIDLATLTGSTVRTFGYEAAALFSNNKKLSSQLIEAGDDCGERCWPLPLWDSYKGDLHSDVADVKNFSGKPIAGAITAAKFLQVFTNEHPAWAHLDIAGVAFGNSPFGKDKAATAYGIRLLVSYLQKNFA